MVQYFVWNEDVPEFPWSWWYVTSFPMPCSCLTKIRGSELGIHTWVYGQLSKLELVGLNRLSGLFVLATVPHPEGQYWVTIAYDHKGQEPI
ncbi:hypothetical protein BS47DRAFT_1194666 [Hydnum rufescens UP504]|uniref:Uncharacterized protein n=1 Tax=Hydnum rufescens UP504 TaxID=1448309 RepID=A0A9P6ASU0_9AGAM|nr:hypothetical protein BS47DRAFT_1194666 [Hydnum rufescens UP504]